MTSADARHPLDRGTDPQWVADQLMKINRIEEMQMTYAGYNQDGTPAPFPLKYAIGKRRRHAFEIGDAVEVRQGERGDMVSGIVKSVIFNNPPQYHVQTDNGLVEYATEVTL